MQNNRKETTCMQNNFQSLLRLIHRHVIYQEQRQSLVKIKYLHQLLSGSWRGKGTCLK